MKQQMVIPWRSTEEPWRLKHFEFLYDYYSDHFEIVIGDHAGDFNRSAARNAGVNACTSDVVIVLDADNYIEDIEQINTSVYAAERNQILAKPFKWFGYLTEDSTNAFYDFYGMPVDKEYDFINPPQVNFTGGAYVMKRSLWQQLGGMDEGFIGWGAEDDAWHITCTKNGIPIQYNVGFDYHLYHPAFRQTSKENYDKLVREYL